MSSPRDARVQEPQREQLANCGDRRDGGGEERIVADEVGVTLSIDSLTGGGHGHGRVTDQRDDDAVLPGYVEGFA